MEREAWILRMIIVCLCLYIWWKDIPRLVIYVAKGKHAEARTSKGPLLVLQRPHSPAAAVDVSPSPNVSADANGAHRPSASPPLDLIQTIKRSSQPVSNDSLTSDPKSPPKSAGGPSSPVPQHQPPPPPHVPSSTSNQPPSSPLLRPIDGSGGTMPPSWNPLPIVHEHPWKALRGDQRQFFASNPDVPAPGPHCAPGSNQVRLGRLGWQSNGQLSVRMDTSLPLLVLVILTVGEAASLATLLAVANALRALSETQLRKTSVLVSLLVPSPALQHHQYSAQVVDLFHEWSNRTRDLLGPLRMYQPVTVLASRCNVSLLLPVPYHHLHTQHVTRCYTQVAHEAMGLLTDAPDSVLVVLTSRMLPQHHAIREMVEVMATHQLCLTIPCDPTAFPVYPEALREPESADGKFRHITVVAGTQRYWRSSYYIAAGSFAIRPKGLHEARAAFVDPSTLLEAKELRDRWVRTWAPIPTLAIPYQIVEVGKGEQRRPTLRMGSDSFAVLGSAADPNAGRLNYSQYFDSLLAQGHRMGFRTPFS